jgi:hypothetical protein
MKMYWGMEVYLQAFLTSALDGSEWSAKLMHWSIYIQRALGYGLNDLVFESRQWMRIFLFTTASRPALGPTQPPVQWVPASLSREVKRSGSEAEHSPPSSAEVKCAWSYTSTPPIRLDGVVLN